MPIVIEDGDVADQLRLMAARENTTPADFLKRLMHERASATTRAFTTDRTATARLTLDIPDRRRRMDQLMARTPKPSPEVVEQIHQDMNIMYDEDGLPK